MHENEISAIVIDSAIKVHKKLGPGLLESACLECLVHELKKGNLKVEKQKSLPLIYDELHLENVYRVDILVEDKVILEIKVVESLNEIFLAQLLTYLKLANCKLGLLMNFNEVKVINGIKRVVNGL